MLPIHKFLLILALLCGFSLSAETIKINANQLEINQKNQTFKYTGQVYLQKQDLELWSEELNGKFNDQQELDDLVANRQVKLKRPPDTEGTANRADWDTRKDLMVLKGNSKVVKAGQIIVADVIEYDVTKNTSQAIGDVNVRIPQS